MCFQGQPDVIESIHMKGSHAEISGRFHVESLDFAFPQGSHDTGEVRLDGAQQVRRKRNIEVT